MNLQKTTRYAKAKVRELEAEGRTALEQLRRLDRRLGVDRGAQKERIRLHRKLTLEETRAYELELALIDDDRDNNYCNYDYDPADEVDI